MNYRPLGRTGWRVSDISFGAWAIAGNWGHVSERALAALNKAVESGVNDLPPRAPREMAEVERIYRQEIRPLVHQRR